MTILAYFGGHIQKTFKAFIVTLVNGIRMLRKGLSFVCVHIVSLLAIANGTQTTAVVLLLFNEASSIIACMH